MTISIKKSASIKVSSGLSVALPATAFLGEGPIWDSERDRLLWVDILEPAIHAFTPSSGTNRRTPMPSTVSAVALAGNGRVLAALQRSIALVNLADGTTREITTAGDEPIRNRFNDGRVDPAGNFWIGSMSMVGERAAGALYRLGCDGKLARILDGIGTANGLGWSPDGRQMYFTDTLARKIHRFDFDKVTGAIENQHTFAEVPEDAGLPDGLSVDSQGFVWSAHWEGWRITCYDPNGSIVRVVKMPVPRPTSCAFGGKGFKTLFITTARVSMTTEEINAAPLSGSLFALPVDIAGQAENIYQGDFS